jgi:hypothetical protein
MLVLILPLVSFSQNNTSSPYSVFGIGDLSNVAFGRNLALGGTGYALRSANYLNLKNPASLTAIDSLSTLFETGVFGKITENTSDKARYYPDGNITHLVLGHRYTNWLMGSYGLMPFSDIGYNFRTYGAIQSEDSFVFTDWKGTGGISKVFYSLGLKINKNLSLGGEVGYFNGPLNQVRNTTLVVEPNNTTSYFSNARYSGFAYKAGIQFTTKLDNKGTGIALGGVFSPAQQLSGRSNIAIQQSYGSSATVLVYNKEERAKPINIPTTYGGGASFTWQGKYLLTADFENALWSQNNSREYMDREVWSVGVEMLPQASLNYFQRCSYRAGFRYDSGYFTTKGKPIDDMRFSLGMGFPLQKSRSTANVTLEAGQRGTTNSGLIMERYTKLTVALSFHDYWFVKRRFD